MDANEVSLFSYRLGHKRVAAWLLLVAPPPLLQATKGGIYHHDPEADHPAEAADVHFSVSKRRRQPEKEVAACRRSGPEGLWRGQGEDQCPSCLLSADGLVSPSEHLFHRPAQFDF